VLPVSVANGLTLALSNTALLHGGVAFNSMIASCTPVSVFFFEQVAGRREHWSDGFIGTLLVCVGSMLCVEGETAASTLCFVLAGGATVCRALKSIIQQELLLGDVSPMNLIFWSSFWSFLLLLPLAAISEGSHGFQALGAVDLRLTLLPIGLSIVCATSVNTTQVFAVQKLGSLLQVMLGNLNSVLVVAIAAAVFREEVLPLQWLGMGVTLIGTNITKKSAPRKEQLADYAPDIPESPCQSRRR
jgi:drug/metabolite transporter (DMT)-like permease